MTGKNATVFTRERPKFISASLLSTGLAIGEKSHPFPQRKGPCSFQPSFYQKGVGDGKKPCSLQGVPLGEGSHSIFEVPPLVEVGVLSDMVLYQSTAATCLVFPFLIRDSGECFPFTRDKDNSLFFFLFTGAAVFPSSSKLGVILVAILFD